MYVLVEPATTRRSPVIEAGAAGVAGCALIVVADAVAADVQPSAFVTVNV